MTDVPLGFDALVLYIQHTLLKTMFIPCRSFMKLVLVENNNYAPFTKL